MEGMSFAAWSLFAGMVLLSLVLLGTFLGRLPFSSAMLYLALGWLLGPAALNVLAPDPVRHAATLEVATEVALLISLFAVGLQLGVPLRDRRWWLPVRLPFVAMAAMVAMMAAVGVWLLGLSPGAAVLLGAILAPTDPVRASGVHSEPGARPDRLGFSLAGEGGLNDGAAFPFVMLGLGLLGVHDAGPGLIRWWSLDLLWGTVGGAAVGGIIGALTGNWSCSCAPATRRRWDWTCSSASV
jgi:sodium/hydrogen antiporter